MAQTIYLVVQRNDVGKITRHIFRTKYKRRAEVYAKAYDGQIETSVIQDTPKPRLEPNPFRGN